MKHVKAFKQFNKHREELRLSEYQLFAKTFCIHTHFIFGFAVISMGAETITALDFSGNGPLFLSKFQMRADIIQAERMLRENYVRYPIFEKSGVKWEAAFQRLADHLATNKNPTLTHHFQRQLIKALEFTE
ncbi:MAG: peptidase S41, partial [SAR324 cluster bacterium]|nr:peptidase S41 [SAR324 cluster bacterium]